MNRGIHTSEFWITVATGAGLLAASIGGVLPAKWAALATAVSVVAYNLARGMAKHGGAEAFTALVEGEPAETHPAAPTVEDRLAALERKQPPPAQTA